MSRINSASRRVSEETTTCCTEGGVLPHPNYREIEKEMTREASLMFHLCILEGVMDRIGNRVTERHGLTMAQWRAMCAVRHTGEAGITHSDLGNMLLLSKAPITGIVDRLERSDFVRRTTDRSDRRVSRIIITERGEKIWEQVKADLLQLAARVTAGLPPSELERTVGVLRHLLQAASQEDITPAETPASLARETLGEATHHGNNQAPKVPL